MKTVGVVIATYNGENFLNEQLQSIIIQTKRPEKIIIVDDCSTDRTKEIIKEYAKMFPDLFIFIQFPSILLTCFAGWHIGTNCSLKKLKS